MPITLPCSLAQVIRAVRRLFKRGVTFVTTPKPLVHACSCFLLSFTRPISGRWSKFVLLQKHFLGCFVSFPGSFQSKHCCTTFKSGHCLVWHSCKHKCCITSVGLNYYNKLCLYLFFFGILINTGLSPMRCWVALRLATPITLKIYFLMKSI